MIIGYHASHEQFSPSQLLAYAKQADEAGFEAVMTSDHIAPWSERQGNSGNNWAWLGAAMAGTSVPFGSLSIPGGWRHHPVDLAHMIATLAQMFPDRLPWIAVGSGEAANEIMVGNGWPEKQERNERLRAGTEIMRALLRGETVTAQHPGFAAEQARLWSLPEKPPALFGAALTPETAEWLGSWADGFITVHKPKAELQQIVSSFQRGGGTGKPMALQLQVCWAETKEEARMIAWDQWRHAALPPRDLADLRTPQAFDEAVKDVPPKAMDDVVPLVSSGEEVVHLIEDGASCGFGEIYIHGISRDQEGFIRAMGRDVLPAFRYTSSGL
ncbi:TIGR03885 family FMN-dependent LLM class oxidoreductase [Neorhizobium lilium]|uniref:TIGR03885 family FMN-dependent LLM class oxidoreductase n=1 Tax=Neorhizobium lilium TaxID=2503024 RepID=A0A3S3VKV3_9HYPH|nr:TIGR03885 family FMN-dependent LLM class oxidoreductase [Neorhizobium lilium]RWX78969.1 TIGR03885 family FMN-dependent LLM class oxidoreductase [Neorhizobium lilium]